MPDLLYLVVTVAFFAAGTGLVTLCDRIVGPDGDHGSPQGSGEPEPVDTARPATPVADRTDPVGAVR